MVSSVKLAELWQRIGYRVVVVCMGRSAQRARSSEQWRKADIERISETLEIHRLTDFFIPDPWNYGIAFGFSGYVVRLVKKIQPDLVVVNKLLFWSSLSTIALRLRGFRVIQLTDALVGMTWWPRGWFPQVCAAIYAWTFGWIELLCASRIVFFHPQPASLLKRLGIFGKSEVIPTGIEVTGYGLRVTGPETRNSKPATITYVGRLESIKGVDDFLAAVVPIIEKNPVMKVQVVGWYKEGHPQVEKYQRHVTFTGLRSDIAEILSKTDIFVLPSHSEGLSNALMEAMASGCACIASDVGGNRYLIQNGVSGFLFPAGDREALRSHMQRLIEDPVKRQSLGKAARERIEKMFSWEIVGKQYAQLFSECISQK
jgi:glycosyltransferase involved in cell wall biosynthesis